MQAPETETPTSPTLIKSFDGNFAFLSNFMPAEVVFEGHHYPTVEHAFQAAKSLNPIVRLGIRNAPTPGKAKQLGRQCKLRADWDQVKYNIMKDLVRQKFGFSSYKKLLLATGNAYIEEGNTWGDTIWGRVDGKGLNWLGIILMEIREELRAESDDWMFVVVDISKAPDNDRIREAISNTIAFENYDGDGWDSHTQMLLWQRVDDIYAEEYGKPKRPYPFGGFETRVNYLEAKEEADPGSAY